MYGDGLSIAMDDAARVRAAVQEEAFVTLGDNANDHGVVISSGAGATGRMDVSLHNNTAAACPVSLVP